MPPLFELATNASPIWFPTAIKLHFLSISHAVTRFFIGILKVILVVWSWMLQKRTKFSVSTVAKKSDSVAVSLGRISTRLET